MKTRILSLLLLAAMIVTALPLAALPVIATENVAATPKVYEAGDYNDLYVKDGLKFATDFFKTNKWWNTEGIEYKAPLGPSDNSAYEYDGKTYNFRDNVADRYGFAITKKSVTAVDDNGKATWDYAYLDATIYTTEEDANEALAAMAETDRVKKQDPAKDTVGDFELFINERATPAFIAARSTWASADYSYIKNTFPSFVTSSITLFSYPPTFDPKYVPNTSTHYNRASYNTAVCFSAYTVEDGYIRIRDTLHSSAGLQFSGTGSYASDSLSLQFTAALGGKEITNNQFLIFHNVRPYVTSVGDEFKLSGAAKNNNFNNPTNVVSNFTVKNTATDVISMTVTLKAKSGEETADSLILSTQNGEMGSVNGTLTLDQNNHYFGHGNYNSGMRIYAVRYYNAPLSETELLQNHFADVAKFFRLDITNFLNLNDANRENVYREAAKYDLGDERATVAAAVEGKAEELLLAQYRADYGSALSDEALSVAAYYGVDLSLIRGIPAGILPHTLSFLLYDYRQSENIREDAAAAIALDLAEYASAGTMEKEDYNALYVKDGIVYAVDFFHTNLYWGEAAESYTTTAAFQKAIKDRVWEAISGGPVLGTNFVTGPAYIKNGYLDLTGSSEQVVFSGLNAATGAGFDEDGGATADVLLDFSAARGSTLMFNNLRMNFSSGTGVFSNIHLQTTMNNDTNATSTVLSSKWGDSFTTNATKHPVSLALAYSLPKPAKNYGYGTKLYDGVNFDRTILSDVYIGSYISVEGEDAPVLSVTKADSTIYAAPLYYPTMQKLTVSYLDGKKVDPFTANVIFLEGNTVKGFVGVYENGSVLWEDNEASFLASAGIYDDSNHINWSSAKAHYYAFRYYNRTLDASELLRNHFADLAKWFRLNLSGIELLDDKTALYEALADFTLESSRAEVQAAVLSVLAPAIRKTYDDMKGEDEELNAFLDLAYEYLLDTDDVRSSSRDMSLVYELVTASKLAGKDSAAAQRFLDETYIDVYYYLVYCRDGETEWNNFIGDLVDSPSFINTERLMALPFSRREGVVAAVAEQGLSQDVIDAYVEAEMLAFADYGTAAITYDDLYVRDGLLYAADFFKTNRYWNIAEEAFAPPTSPAEMTAFVYGDKTYNFRDYPDSRYCYRPLKDGSYIGSAEFATAKEAIDSIPEDQREGVTAVLAINAAYTAAIAQWKKEDLAFFRDNFVTYADTTHGSLYLSSYYPSFSATASESTILYNADKTLTVYTTGEGFIQLRTDLHSSAGLQFNGYSSYQNKISASCQQAVLVGSGNLESVFIIMADLRPNIAKHDGTNVAITSIGGSSFTQSSFEGTGLTFRDNALEATDFTISVAYGTPVYNDKGALDHYQNSVSVGRTEDGELYTATGTYKPNHSFYIGWSAHAKSAKLYAYRQYEKALTQEEVAQNHFADITKYFRLNLAPYTLLTDSEKAQLTRDFLKFDVASSRREDVIAAYMNVVDAHFDVLTAGLDRDFAEIVKTAALDITPLLAIHEVDARRAIASKITANYTAELALDNAVLSYELREAMRFLDSIDFFGTQVRVSTVEKVTDELNPGDMPGIRQIFKIGEAELYDLVKANGTVTFGATIYGEKVSDTTLSFTATLEGEKLKIEGGNTTTLTYGDEDFRAFVYTVTYDGFASYDPEVAKELYGIELSYRFFLTVDGLTYTRDAVHSIFGDKISATEVYQHFYDNSKELTPPNWGVSFAEDAIVKKVLGIAE